MMIVRRLLAIVAIPLIASNCMALSGRCLYEVRGVAADGSVTEGGTEIATAHLDLGEQRDYQPDKTLIWSVTGPILKGHVQRMVLRDIAAGSSILYDFALNDSGIQTLSSGFVSQSGGATINGIFDLLASNRGVIVITTDIPARTTVTVPLTVTRKDDWSRPYCS